MSDHVENIEDMDSIVEKEIEDKLEHVDEVKEEESIHSDSDEDKSEDGDEAESKDSDEDSDEEEDEDEEEEAEEEEEDYDYGCRKRSWCDYDDYECKKCKLDDSYVFVRINPVILTSVPKLMDMASVAVAATLWNHVNVHRAVSGVSDRCTKSTKKWTTLCGKVIELIDRLPVPKRIAEQINRYVRIMTNQMTSWVSYHYRTVFLKNGPDKFVYSLVDHLVWYPNGAINCVQTARSMITSLRLSDIEKFRFLSVYCLKDEMDQMSPSLYMDNIRDYPSFHENPMIFYWYCFYRNKLSKIRRTNGYDQNLSIDVYMLHHSKVDNWSAKKYFFDRLNFEEQVREAIWLIDQHGVIYQKAVMLKLDETQRVHVYMEQATKIIVNYARPRINSRSILQTWFEARNLMSQDQFLTLIRELLKTEIKDELITQIWTSASDNLKQHVVGANNHEIVGKILREWKWCDSSDFIFVLLHDSSMSVRKSVTTKKFFNTYCERLIMNSKFKEIHRLLEFCLSDAEDLARFKICFVNSSESDFFNTHCEKLLMTSKFQELDLLLEYCLPVTHNLAQFKIKLVTNSEHMRKTCLKFYSSGDSRILNDYLKRLLVLYPDVIVQYKKNLITSLDGLKLCVDVMDAAVNVLDKVLKDSLTDSESIIEYKKNMIFSPEAIVKLKGLLLNKRLHSVQICIDRHLTSTDDKNALKKQLIGDVNMQLIHSMLRNNDESYLQSVLIWRIGNENSVQDFKRTLHLDSIFMKMLKDCVFYEYDRLMTKCRFKHCTLNSFNVLDRLLNWYFQSPDKVKEYRMRIIRSHSKIDMFQTILRGSRADDQLKVMLQWFFKNDAVEIAKFRKLGGKISGMI